MGFKNQGAKKRAIVIQGAPHFLTWYYFIIYEEKRQSDLFSFIYYTFKRQKKYGAYSKKRIRSIQGCNPYKIAGNTREINYQDVDYSGKYVLQRSTI